MGILREISMDYDELRRRRKEQKDEMTCGERAMIYQGGGEVDYLPYSIMSADAAIVYMYKFTQKQYRESFDIRCEVLRRKKEDFGLEGISVGPGLKGMGKAVGSIMAYPENGMDYVKEFFLRNYDALEVLEPVNPKTNESLRSIIKETHNMKKVFPDMGIRSTVAGPLSTAASIRPIELILRDIRRNPEKLHQLIEYGVTCSLSFLQEFVNEFGNVDVEISDPVTTTDIISKVQFETFSKPYLRQLIDGIKKITGKNPMVHICGSTYRIWEDLMDVGVKQFSLDNNESLKDAKKCMGHCVQLAGNVPPVSVMMQGSIDDVINCVKNCIIECSDNACGYTLNTGCQVPIGTPIENMEAFVYAAKYYGSVAKKGQLCKGVLNEL